jgi:hypothetical protein
MQVVTALKDITLNHRHMMKARQNLVLLAVTEGTPGKPKGILMNPGAARSQASSGLPFCFGGPRGRTASR